MIGLKNKKIFIKELLPHNFHHEYTDKFYILFHFLLKQQTNKFEYSKQTLKFSLEPIMHYKKNGKRLQGGHSLQIYQVAATKEYLLNC